MTNSYLLIYRTLFTGLLLASYSATLAQAPVITSVIPMANARAASRTSPVTVNFSQPLTAASAGALKVFSAQRGGLRTRGATPATVSGSTLSFAPSAYPFMPGETVQYTVTRAAAGSGGALARARVGQFTAAVGGTGRGNFLPGATLVVGNRPYGITVGDIDGDGDLDLVTASDLDNTVRVCLNNGSGLFTVSQVVSAGPQPFDVTVGDLDADGDLDLLTANQSGTASIRLNNGSGVFGSGQDVLVGYGAARVVVADVDSDGDVDLLTANSGDNTVSIRLNNGSGTFSGSQNVSVGDTPFSVAVGDVDGDGDMDLLAANFNFNTGPSTVSVRLNDGVGTFSGNQEVSVSNRAYYVVSGDIDSDGDMDLLTTTIGNGGLGIVSLRLNNGGGTFSAGQDIAVGNTPISLNIGDIDGDGDPDLLTANQSGTASIRLNNGSGVFGGGQDMTVRGGTLSSVVGDIDGDGDLDLITGDYSNSTGTVAVYLNGGTGLATTASRPTAPLTLYPSPAHGRATITGTTPHAPITVLDALGRVLLSATADAAGTTQLALPAAMPAGVYLVRSGQQVRRLAVE